MSHIFISYSHNDKTYAHKLHRHLLDQGFDAWIDDRIDYGSRWPREIEKQLRECAAFILIMSPNSYESEWVQNELSLARQLKKTIFPLLLDGNVWWHLQTTQYVDVEGGKFPPTRFLIRLAEVAPREDLDNPSDIKLVNPNTDKPKDSQPSGMGIGGDVSSSVIVAGSGNVINLGKQQTFTPEKLVENRLVFPKPKAEKSELKKTTPLRKPNTAIIVALIAFASTICAAIIGSPILKNLFEPISPIVTATLSSTATPMATTTPDPNDFFDTSGVPMHFVPSGEFTMGADATVLFEECKKFNELASNCKQDSYKNGEPIHLVNLPDFYIDKYEVTNAFYKICVDEGLCQPPIKQSSNARANYYSDPEFDNYPVVNVDWFMAKSYCEWRGARLPTEAEWEKAARGIDGGIYPWGNNIDCSMANTGRAMDLCVGDTTAVGSYEGGKSAYGLYDMSGNVWEWVEDIYSATYYQESSYENPLGPTAGDSHVRRGGSFLSFPHNASSIQRAFYVSQDYYIDIGFRCALTP